MKNLSISQKYLVCALSKRGGLINRSYESSACIVSSCVFDLLLSNIVAIENEKIIVKETLTKELEYLKPMYKFLKEAGPIKLETVISKFILMPSNKKMKKLIISISQSTQRQGYIEFQKEESFKIGGVFVPILEKRKKIIENLKMEMILNENNKDETIILLSLLLKSEFLEKYFSKKDIIAIEWNKIEETEFYKMIDRGVNYAVSMVVVVSNAGWLLAG